MKNIIAFILGLLILSPWIFSLSICYNYHNIDNVIGGKSLVTCLRLSFCKYNVTFYPNMTIFITMLLGVVFIIFSLILLALRIKIQH